MKKEQNNSSGTWAFRIAPCVVWASIAATVLTANIAAGATIYVTTPIQKISESDGCSLQEAIYSANFHSNIAIDATDPDHFITTQCVAGTGNDTIVLPTGGVFNIGTFLDGDAYNPYGPTATPIIFSTMTIEGYGATLRWTGNGNVRLFAIGPATVTTPNGTVSGTGGLTLRNVHINGFHAKGGDGAPGGPGQNAGGGGGGMGAGGAIYVQNGTLIVEGSTFDSNSAVGGNGTYGELGGGGGIWGNGGTGDTDGFYGGGGGGSKGNGGNFGGGGGGTVFSGGDGSEGGSGGYLWGGHFSGEGLGGFNGQPGQNPGGGGGGGSHNDYINGNGGGGNYGGGGGGGPGGGGAGGFGGGGGSAEGGFGDGGVGGFGGGGGSGSSDNGADGGLFGGHGGEADGGGGAGLGGAIFNDNGSVTIHNSTFYNNSATQGLATRGCPSCQPQASNGDGAGGAIFSRNGSLTLVDVTISGNQSSTFGAGLEVFGNSTASFVIQNTIIANNTITANPGTTAECLLDGNTVNRSGTGNLIVNNASGSFACPGVVTNVDPGLGPLQDNTGYTPTMAIPLYSSAMGIADPATSLPSDQKSADRPQPDSSPRNGYDIGAYTVCRRFQGPTLVTGPCGYTHITPPPPVTLTMQVSPSNQGTTNPAPGSHDESINSVVPIQAIANPGYIFSHWTGSVAQSTNPSTTVTMTQAQTVTANFAAGTPTPTATATPTPCDNGVIANGGFETASFSPWVVENPVPPPVVTSNIRHNGSYSAFAGGNAPGQFCGFGSSPLGDSSFYQQFTVPAQGGTLSFWHWDCSADNLGNDWQDAYIASSSGTILQMIFHQCNNTQAWLNTQINLAAYVGQAIRIKFLVHQNGNSNLTGMYVDDVQLFEPCPSTPTPTPTPIATPTPTPTLTPTPSPSPTPALMSISGIISYCSNPALNPVPGVTMTLTGTSSGSTATNSSGNYVFSGLPSGGSYTVTPAKAALPPGSPGITTVDVIAIQRHYLGRAFLTDCRLLAADCAPPFGVVNTVDVIAVQRFFLGLTTGIGNTGIYQFSPFFRSYSPLTTNQTGQNYNTLVLGDVASSYVY